MLMYSKEYLTPIGYTNSNFYSNPYFKKSTSSLLGDELLFGEVLSKVVSLTPPWNPNMWLLVKLLKKLYGSKNSWWIYKWFLLQVVLCLYTMITVDQLPILRNQEVIKKKREWIERKYHLIWISLNEEKQLWTR